jgi:hypothetical protein
MRKIIAGKIFHSAAGINPGHPRQPEWPKIAVTTACGHPNAKAIVEFATMTSRIALTIG